MNGEQRSRRKTSFAFPYQPSSERGGFIRYMEVSGAVSVFTDVFTALYIEPEKPENPLKWMSNYLRGKAAERKDSLLSTLELRRNEVLEAAKELEQLKLQKNRHDHQIESVQARLSKLTKPSQKENVDERFIEDGGDSRWQIQPDPMFTGTWSKDEIAFQFANIKGLALEAEDEIEDGLIVVENPNAQVSDFPPSGDEYESKHNFPSSLQTPKESIRIDLEQHTSTVPFFDHPDLLPFYDMIEKSTETSPQPSGPIFIHELGAESDNEEETQEKKLVTKLSWENIPVPPPSAVGSPQDDASTLKDGRRNEHITDEFWTDDFTLGKVESEDEDLEHECISQQFIETRNKLQAKRYRAQSNQEHAWLPWQLGHYTNEAFRPSESEVIIQDVLGTLTMTTRVIPDNINKISEKNSTALTQKKNKQFEKYEWIKKEHGVQQLRPIRKGEVINEEFPRL